jgi:hypothetical protein
MCGWIALRRDLRGSIEQRRELQSLWFRLPAGLRMRRRKVQLTELRARPGRLPGTLGLRGSQEQPHHVRFVLLGLPRRGVHRRRVRLRARATPGFLQWHLCPPARGQLPLRRMQQRVPSGRLLRGRCVRGTGLLAPTHVLPEPGDVRRPFPECGRLRRLLQLVRRFWLLPQWRVRHRPVIARRSVPHGPTCAFVPLMKSVMNCGIVLPPTGVV